MIYFNTLNILAKDKTLVLDIAVPTSTYFNNVYIDKILIDTQDTFTIDSPSATPIYSYIDTTDTRKNLSLFLTEDMLNISASENSINLDSDLLYVYVITKGDMATDTPIALQSNITLKTIYNSYSILQNSMLYIKELKNTSKIPKNFIDYILRKKALDISILTENYTHANLIWEEYFKQYLIKTL